MGDSGRKEVGLCGYKITGCLVCRITEGHGRGMEGHGERREDVEGGGGASGCIFHYGSGGRSFTITEGEHEGHEKGTRRARKKNMKGRREILPRNSAMAPQAVLPQDVISKPTRRYGFAPVVHGADRWGLL